MAGTRELRGRITTVGNIKQITRAMEMVSTTKLRRFQDRAIASRPYAEEITNLVTHLASVLGEEVERRALFRAGAGTRTAVLLVSSDRGLCGAYNSNVLRALETWIIENPETIEAGVDWYCYGKKGYQYQQKRGREVTRYFAEPPLEKIDYRGAANVARVLVDGFLSGELREVKVLYTAFESMARFVPTWIDFLPVPRTGLTAESSSADAATFGDVILEPDAETIFDALVPKYLETRIYNALIEALTSEFASRRMSMKNATEAAGDMQNSLKKVYNRARQESITKELLDIVGGVEALR